MRIGEILGIVGTRFTARAIAARSLRTAVEGLEHLPSSGPVVLAVRHYHHLYDGAALIAALPRHVRILVALDWAATPSMRRMMEGLCGVAGWPVVLRRDAMISAGRPSAYARSEFAGRTRAGLRRAIGIVTRGDVLAVFPEGYPAIDPAASRKGADDLLPFAPGIGTIARLAGRTLGAAVPIVPVGLRYDEVAGRTGVRVVCGAARFVGPGARDPHLLAALRTDVGALSALPHAV